MQNYRIFNYALRAILVMASFVFISCEKSTGEIGLDNVENNQAELGTKKSLPLITYNVLYDSIPGSGPSQEVLGNFIDPYLGSVKARFNTHLLLSELNPDFGDAPICDSVVMFVEYNGYYGDTSQSVNIKVHELAEFFDADSTYQTTHRFDLGQEIGLTNSLHPRPKTVINFNGEDISPAMKLQLDPAYFQQKLIDAAATNPEHFTDNDVFTEYMNGIEVSQDGISNGVLYFDVGGLSSFVHVYYRQDAADTVARFYEMILGKTTVTNFASRNGFELDPSMGGPNLDLQDSINGEALVYSQAMGGVNAQILLPDLKAFADSNWVINRAELVLHVRDGSVGKYELPDFIYLIEDVNGVRYRIDDYFGGGLPPDGTLTIGELREKSYTFNMTRFVNRLINTQDTIYPLILRPNFSSSNSWRAVISGNQDPVNPPAFNIFYTKTKK